MTQGQKLKGVWTAIATPFLSDNSIDWPSFENLLKAQEAAGISGIVVCGTTGEAPTLSTQEKLALIRKARALLGDQVRVMAGSGGSNTNQTIELSRLAVDAGADSLLIVTPPYNKPSLAGLKGHFEAVAESVNVPLCLYHVPGRTAQSLSPQAIAELCKIPSVIAVKEASGDIGLFSRANLLSAADFLSGDDPTYLASLSVGGTGVISVVSNVFPKAMVALTQAFESSNQKQALTYHNALLAFIDVLFCEANPGPLKAALAIEGYGQNHVRMPLAPVTEANYEAIRSTLAQTKLKLERAGLING